ncbi:hypothetical protein EMIHUDRAFT_449910 [Emiliania huxleyi CCMP1516]|uniref:Nucleolar pre-ribosomal-associated protein 1 C-terminal domain-containing protein n=2 Tax=Emiliania huxleyi TaxID=2903 RepID=A0A0D3K0X4_EMIH1|nr:hypothetical protein EMIHUDRAFT_449910 [Emiliania huxleyi CCMP1516]EOD29409.1 hypothetical protein EMIHUDRAFT_449910 [Emiliania huxleyi CCMP1516]|eukprot:XP_005781838.1 hypothetical protein EMIHUDRAFT_449910 [Emiliania huxleyi CCMP1516]
MAAVAGDADNINKQARKTRTNWLKSHERANWAHGSTKYAPSPMLSDSLCTCALLLEQLHASGTAEHAQSAAQLANRVWQRRGDRLFALLEPASEGDADKVQAASLRCLKAMATASDDVARAIVQRSIGGGSSVVALLNGCEKPRRSREVCGALVELVAVLLRVGPRELLSAEHGRLASSPLRLVEWLPRGARLRGLAALQTHVLGNGALSFRLVAPVANHAALAKLAPLLSAGGDLCKVTAAFLLKLSEPTVDPQQQQLALALLAALPGLRAAYLQARGDAALDPKPTRQWVVAFLVRVVGLPQLQRCGAASEAAVQRAPPPGLGRQFWSRGLLHSRQREDQLQHSSLLVRATTVNALVAVLASLGGDGGGRARSKLQAASASRLLSLMHGRLLHALALYHTLMPAVFAEGRLQARALARALVPGLPSAAPIVQQSALRLLLPQQGGGGGGAELPPAAELLRRGERVQPLARGEGLLSGGRAEASIWLEGLSPATAPLLAALAVQELDPGQGRLPQGRRAELAGRYLREVLASLQRLADGRARPLLRTALLLQLPCGVPADARACLLALGVSHRRAQTALLEGLWSAGGGRASSSLDAALQRWLYAEPAAAAQLVHAAAETGELALVRRFGAEPLALHLLGACVAAAVDEDRLAGAGRPAQRTPAWLPLLYCHFRLATGAGSMLPLPRSALPHCLLRIAELIELEGAEEEDSPAAAPAAASAAEAAVEVFCTLLLASPGWGEGELSGVLPPLRRRIRSSPAPQLDRSELDADVAAGARLATSWHGEHALGRPSLELVEAADALRLAASLLRGPCGPHMAPLAPALRRLLELRRPLRESMRAPDAHELLDVLSALAALQPAPMGAPMAVELLVGCAAAVSSEGGLRSTN